MPNAHAIDCRRRRATLAPAHRMSISRLCGANAAPRLQMPHALDTERICYWRELSAG